MPGQRPPPTRGFPANGEPKPAFARPTGSEIKVFISPVFPANTLANSKRGGGLFTGRESYDRMNEMDRMKSTSTTYPPS